MHKILEAIGKTRKLDAYPSHNLPNLIEYSVKTNNLELFNGLVKIVGTVPTGNRLLIFVINSGKLDFLKGMLANRILALNIDSYEEIERIIGVVNKDKNLSEEYLELVKKELNVILLENRPDFQKRENL